MLKDVNFYSVDMSKPTPTNHFGMQKIGIRYIFCVSLLACKKLQKEENSQNDHKNRNIF